MATINKKSTGIDYVSQIQNKNKAPVGMKVLRTSISMVSKFSDRLASKILAYIFFKPRKMKATAETEKYYSQGDNYFFFVENKLVFKHVRGTGPSVILAHGWGSSSFQLRHIAGFLVEAGFRVLSFDAIAHGRSDGKQTNLVEYSQIFSEIINQEENNIEAIIGHSMGGTAAFLAFENHINVRKLVTIASPVSMDTIINPFQSILGINDKLMERVIERIEAKVNRKLEHIEPATNFKNQELPTLMFHDKYDQVIPLKQSIDFSDRFANISLIETEGLNHRDILKSTFINEKILEFLNN